jgi:hypothetical protein
VCCATSERMVRARRRGGLRNELPLVRYRRAGSAGRRDRGGAPELVLVVMPAGLGKGDRPPGLTRQYTLGTPVRGVDVKGNDDRVNTNNGGSDASTATTRSDPPGEDGVGTCFGFAVRAPFPLMALRTGQGIPLEVIEDGSPPEHLGEPLLSWVEGDRALVRLYQQPGEYLVWVESDDWFRIDPDAPSITCIGSISGPRREARIFGLPAALCFMPRGYVAVHAAAVDVEGSALLLAAPGRFGKTTLAAAFAAQGYRLLAEDTTCYRPSPDPSVLPGLAMLRIRPDVHEHLVIPGATVVAKDPERVFVVLDESGRGDGEPVPLRGVVILRVWDRDEVMLERVASDRVIPDLWTLTFHFPDDRSRAECFQAVVGLATSVPIWNLYRRLSFEQLPAVIERIVSTCLD